MSDIMSLLVLLTDLRCALGDNGLRMQPELVEYARELKAKADDADRLRAELDIATHKVICCGVAASHPDPGLTTSGAYADKWNSPQAEAVRALRRERDSLRAVSAWQPISTAPKDGSIFLGWVAAERWSAVDGGGSGLSHDVSQVDFCWWREPPPPPSPEAYTGGYFDNAAGQVGDGQDITHWQPLPAPPEAA